MISDRAQGHKKRSQNAQPQNENSAFKGAWGRCPQQADGRKCECVLTLALLARLVWLSTRIACAYMFDFWDSIA